MGYNLIIAICITYNIYGAYIEIMEWNKCIICRRITTVQLSCLQMKENDAALKLYREFISNAQEA